MPNQGDALRAFANSIAATIADYRSGEIAQPTAEHVLRWATQFPDERREGLLSGLDHLFKKTYIPKSKVLRFLTGVTKPSKFTGPDPATFWKAANVLDIQGGGSSQRDMKPLLADVLGEELNLRLEESGSPAGAFIYLDDVIFSGNRVVMDCRNWIPAHAPNEFSLQVLVAACHSGADYYVEKQIRAITAEANKKLLSFGIWRLKTLNNRKDDASRADVLRLREYPDDAESKAYWEKHGQGKAPALLRGNGDNQSPLYASEDQRDHLEQTFWHAGVSIKERCGHLKIMHRPLGYTSTNSENKLGFGSLIVTYRNCPNNSPLALWAGDPWYPLLPRRVN